MALTVQAIYDFDAQPGSGELSLRTGDIINVSRQDVGDGWWEGINAQGEQGLFPESYVQVSQADEGPPAMPPPPLPSGYGSPVQTQSSVNSGWAVSSPTASSTATWGAQNGNASAPPQNQRSVSEDAFDDDWSDDDSQTQVEKKRKRRGRNRRALSLFPTKLDEPVPKSSVAVLLSMSSMLTVPDRPRRQSSEFLEEPVLPVKPHDKNGSEKRVSRDSSTDEIEERQTQSWAAEPRPQTRTRSDTEDSRTSSADKELDSREEPTHYGHSMGSSHGRPHSSSGDGSMSNRGTVKKNINRFSNFVKSGTEGYILTATKPTTQPAEKHAIALTPDGPQWTPITQPYQCIVDKPKKESKFKGIKSFIAYQITPSFNGIQVSRRYKHFDWLHERLVEKYTLVPIPPLPEKQVSGKFEDDLIEHRKQILQLWVAKICRHPVLSKSDVWIHFMTCTDDKKWKQGKRKAEKDEYTGGNFFMSLEVPPQPLDPNDVDNRVETFSRMAKSLDDSIKGLFDRAHESAKKMAGPQKREFQKMAVGFLALSESFLLDQSSYNHRITDAMKRTADCYHEIAQLCEQQPKKDAEPMMDALYSYKGMLSAVPDSVHVQKSALTKLRDHEKLSQDGKISQGEAETIRTRVDTISYAMLAEVNHFHRERVTDFKLTMTDYLQNQIEFYQQIVSKLQGALHEFESA